MLKCQVPFHQNEKDTRILLIEFILHIQHLDVFHKYYTADRKRTVSIATERALQS